MKFTKTFTKAVDYLWNNRKELKKKFYNKDEPKPWEYQVFDYPDYYGMPKRISNKLDGDFVDALQRNTYLLLKGEFKTKKEFIKELLEAGCWNPMSVIKW